MDMRARIFDTNGEPLAPRRLTITVQQTAAILGVSVPTIWSMLSNKRLESIALNRRRLILYESVEALVESLRGAPGDARRATKPCPAGATNARRRAPKGRTSRPPVKDLELSTRATNALINDGVRTLEDLVAKTDSELLLVPNLGRGSLAEIKAALAKRGLREKDVADSR
jgi:excisionase family DNA binding protein